MIYKAQVIDTEDPEEIGQFWVYSQDISEDLLRVTYVSPFFNRAESGMVAIPSPGAEVLISQVHGEDLWYYIGSIVAPLASISREGTKLKSAKESTLPDKSIYKARGIPQKTVLKDDKGNSLTLSNQYNSEFFSVGARLKSGVGKQLILSDSPKMDSVILRNEHGDRIKITSEADNTTAKRAIDIESQGPQRLISRESGISFQVVEGRELNLKNSSTGLNKNPSDPEKYGNINLDSERNDINLTTRAEDGKIFIDALGTRGLIQIDSSGKVIINAENGSVSIKASEDIIMSAGGDVQINAGGSFHVNSGDDAAITCSNNLSLQAGPKVAIDSDEIHLNSSVSQPARVASPEPKETNNYGN